MTPEEVARYLRLAVWCHCAIDSAESTIHAYKDFLRVAVRLFGTAFLEWVEGLTNGLPQFAQTVAFLQASFHRCRQNEPHLLIMGDPVIAKSASLEGMRALYSVINAAKAIRGNVLSDVDIHAPEAVLYHMMCILDSGTVTWNSAPQPLYQQLIMAMDKVFAHLCELNEQCSYVIRALRIVHDDWDLLPQVTRHRNQDESN